MGFPILSGHRDREGACFCLEVITPVSGRSGLEPSFQVLSGLGVSLADQGFTVWVGSLGS
jgi:hypothetical protein